MITKTLIGSNIHFEWNFSFRFIVYHNGILYQTSDKVSGRSLLKALKMKPPIEADEETCWSIKKKPKSAN